MVRSTRARIFAIALGLGALSACSLFTSLNGFSDNPPVVDNDDAADSSSSGIVEGGGESSSSSSGDVTSPSSSFGLSCTEDRLVLALSFDEGTGTVVRDCSPTGVEGKFGNFSDGNIAFGRRKDGGALEFQKSGGVVVLPPRPIFDFNSSMTLAAFIRSEGKPSGGYIGLPWHYAPGGFEIILSGSGDFYTTFLYGPSKGEIDTQLPPLVQGKWTHVAVVYETNTRFEVFIDGVSISRKTNLGGSPDPNAAPTQTEIHIGSLFDGNIVWTGGIDELRIYKRALSNEEITALASR
jgi:hypothetical protein